MSSYVQRRLVRPPFIKWQCAETRDIFAAKSIILRRFYTIPNEENSGALAKLFVARFGTGARDKSIWIMRWH